MTEGQQPGPGVREGRRKEKSMFPGQRRQILSQMEKLYGKDPRDFLGIERCRERLPEIRILHDMLPGEKAGIDEVTFADLEMEEVFLRINQTRSYIGEQTLYHVLHSGRDEFFSENRAFLDELEKNDGLRKELSLKLWGVGKRQESYHLPEFLPLADALRPRAPWVFRGLQGILAGAVLFALAFRTRPFQMGLLAILLVNFAVHIVMKMKYQILLSSLSGIGALLGLYDWCLAQKDSPLPVTEEMRKGRGKLKRLLRKIGILVYVAQAGSSGDWMGLLFDYAFGVTLIDVARVDSILRLMGEYREELFSAFLYVGRLDAAISVLSFRKSLPYWSKPDLGQQGPLEFEGLYHPLLREPVGNDFSLAGRAILTGANASGKSTFMKALAVGVILGQTIDTVCCRRAGFPLLKVMTSMAIRDDVVTGESYYVREVRYLKRMLDEIGRGTPALFVIDEILKGTNQKERLAASEAVLKYLSRYPGYCILATHDGELVERLEGAYEPYFFESRIADNTVTFDYRIHKGRGGGSNALALLQAFGFPREVVEEAYHLIAEA